MIGLTREEVTMRTVNEVSKLTGISVRTLHHYDEIGLLRPTEVTEAGYRLYDDIALERLQHILLFKELEFPLKDIKKILDSSDFDRNKALEQQIELLTMKMELWFYIVQKKAKISQVSDLHRFVWKMCLLLQERKSCLVGLSFLCFRFEFYPRRQVQRFLQSKQL